ncbi:putative FHA domain-containing protein [Candidatus Magnetomoraceae bacterium gMMP-15]
MSKKICDNCGAENPVSEEYCEECGFPLEDLTFTDSSKDSLKCPNCNNPITDDIKFCDNCGANLVDLSNIDLDDTNTSQTSADPPDPDTTTAISQTSHKNWKLKTVEGLHVGKEYLLYKDEMLIGRMDEEDGIFPDIDLEGQDEGYVSRCHATIRIIDGKVSLEDMNAANKTMVDNKPIKPDVQVFVSENQVIRIGKVGLMLQVD